VLVNFLQFVANLIIAMALLKVIQAKMIERDPDSAFAKSLAFVIG
jgi:hypothetical protein